MHVAQPVSQAPTSQSKSHRFGKNAAANVTRLGITTLVALLLPAYLTHELPVQIYGAWVLILQLGAYVGYLDLGVQTAISKYIAEYEARNDIAGCGRCASTGLVIMLVASAAGVLLTFGLAWAVPELFRNMPAGLYPDVRASVIFVGISLSVNLSASIFSAIFLGLQRYDIPMLTTVIGKVCYAVGIFLAAHFHSRLLLMGAIAAATNLLSALLQVIAWKKLASHIRVSLSALDRGMLRQMLEYCFVLTIWSVCMLFIGGIDLTIVGHYDFGEVAFYSVATAPTTFILMLIGAVLGPLLPATSALSTERTAEQMGEVLLRATRLATVILLASGLPIIVAGYWLLRVWVGPFYSIKSIQLLRILVFANIIRQLCAPYATMVVATARQRVATASAIVEAAVNLAASIWLARMYGATGVALGTLIGSVAGVTAHFAISMRYTRNIAVSRLTLLLRGIVRPAAMAIPSLLFFRQWASAAAPEISLQGWLFWCGATVLIAYFVGMEPTDRNLLLRLARLSNAGAQESRP
jgi:O-antigen/teichoic acid export membrane protein